MSKPAVGMRVVLINTSAWPGVSTANGWLGAVVEKPYSSASSEESGFWVKFDNTPDAGASYYINDRWLINLMPFVDKGEWDDLLTVRL